MDIFQSAFHHLHLQPQVVSFLRAGHFRAVIAALSEVSLRRVLPGDSLLPQVILASHLLQVILLILFYDLIHY